MPRTRAPIDELIRATPSATPTGSGARIPFWDYHFDVDYPGPYYAPGETDAEGNGSRGYEWIPDNPWDTMQVADLRIPGLVMVNAARKRYLYIYQVQGAPPSISLAGYDALRFTVQARIWTPRMWESMQRLAGFLMPKVVPVRANRVAVEDNQAFDVNHPALAFIGIKSAVCIGLGPISGDQMKTVSFEFLEYRRGRQAVAQVQKSRDVAAAFNANQQANKQVIAESGKVPRVRSTQGPQPKPSSAPSLSRTP